MMGQASVKEGREARRTLGLIVENLMVSALKLRPLGPYRVGGADPRAGAISLSGDLCWFLCSLQARNGRQGSKMALLIAEDLEALRGKQWAYHRQGKSREEAYRRKTVTPGGN